MKLILEKGDWAIVLRRDGKLDLVVPKPDEETLMTEDRFVLAGFALEFKSRQIREVIKRVLMEERLNVDLMGARHPEKS